MGKTAAQLAFSLTLSSVTLVAALGSVACMMPGSGQRPVVVGRSNTGWAGSFDDAAWQTVRRDDAQLSFQMPAPPSVETESSRLDDGRRVTRTFGTTRSRGLVFGYVVMSFEEGLGGALLGELDDLVDATIETAEGAEIESAEALWLAGYPGTELRLTNETERVTTTMRHYIGRSRAYLFFVSVPHGREADAQVGADRFFASIVFDPFDAPSVNGNGTFQAASAWRWISPPEGAFAIELPGEPQRVEESLVVDDHELDVYAYSLSGNAPSIHVRIAAIGIDARAREHVVEAIDRELVANGGNITRTEHGARGGHPMRRVEVARAGQTTHSMIVYGSRIAHVVSIASETQDEPSVAPIRERIFGSFIRP